MTDVPGCFSESPQKGHQQDYGRNKLGITVSPFRQSCKRCEGDIFIGQRVMKDPDAKSWPHLECANPEWFSRVDDDSCTAPAVARLEDGKRKFCAWCTEEIIADEDKWKACWMGWVHAECDPGDKSDFVEILRRLQHRYPGRSMPHQCHQWKTLEELKSHTLQGHYLEHPVYEAVDSSWTQQARADQGNKALATRDLVSAFSSNGILGACCLGRPQMRLQMHPQRLMIPQIQSHLHSRCLHQMWTQMTSCLKPGASDSLGCAHLDRLRSVLVNIPALGFAGRDPKDDSYILGLGVARWTEK